MADMHVLAGSGGRWQVVMHFAVPGGTNAAGVLWSDVLTNSGIGGSTILPDGDGTGGTIDATEKVAIVAGTVLEHVGRFLVESGGTSAAGIRGSLREFYGKEKAAVIAQLQRQLRYFGATESEA